MFDFDGFVNKPSIQIFGRSAIITPADNQFASFEIKLEFRPYSNKSELRDCSNEPL